jgi:hypothetical protein
MVSQLRLADHEAQERMVFEPGEKEETPREVKPMRVAVSRRACSSRDVDAHREQNPETEVFGPTARGYWLPRGSTAL